MDKRALEEIKRYFGTVGKGLERQIQQVADDHRILVAGQEKILERVDKMLLTFDFG